MLVKIIKLENELNINIDRVLLDKVIRVEEWDDHRVYWCDDYMVFIPSECCKLVRCLYDM